MIIRMWRAVAGTEQVLETYADYLRSTTFAEMAELPGHLGATLTRKVGDDEFAIMVMSFWEDFEASGQFEGRTQEDAVVKESTQKLLQSFDLKVEYFEPIVSTGIMAP